MGMLSTWRPARHLTKIPVVTLMPHSRCNCRCVMCDIWKANRNGTSIDEATVDRLVEDFRALGVSLVALSGGEALMHPNLWELCRRLKSLPVTISLLSSGLLLARHAEEITRWCDEVIVSLDGPEATHDRIRGIEGAYRATADGIAALRKARPGFPVSARSVVQKGNFRQMSNTVAAARSLGFDHISFLAADLSSTAFNRPEGWEAERVDEVGLSDSETDELASVIEAVIAYHADGFVRESPARLRRIVAHYRNTPAPVSCNAPWVSAVVEADGTVRPCFFHAPIGNLAEGSLAEIVNSPKARAFRGALDMRRDPVCRNCVCTLKL